MQKGNPSQDSLSCFILFNNKPKPYLRLVLKIVAKKVKAVVV